MENRMFRSTAKLSVLYFLIYCPLGALCPMISTYLNSIGFSGTQVGIVTSLGTATAFFAGLFWGGVYSNSHRKRWILAFMCAAAAALALLGTGTKLFFVYTVIYCCMYFFQSPLHGLCDSFVLSEGGNFPIVRSMGAIGYALTVFAAGELAEARGMENIFYIYAAAFLLAIVVIFCQKEPPYYKERSEDKIKISALLSNKTYIKLVICAFFVMGTNIAHNTYFAYLFREGGGDVSGLGLAFLLMAGSEAPFMILLPGLMKKFTSEKLILTAMIVSVIRFGYFATGPAAAMLLKTFFLQGIVNGILLVEVVKYVDRVAGPKHSGVAIAVYYAVTNNLSVILCNLAGGIVLDVLGARGVYGFLCIMNVISVVLYIAMGLYRDQEKLVK